LGLNDPIVAISAGGGMPIKLDAGGRARDVRERWADYFVADVDTSRGSSGAGAFTQEFALLGVLARGGLDFVDRGAGCYVTNRTTEENAHEQFTYAHRAITGLCQKDPTASSLCRLQCDEPCQALPLPVTVARQGCSLATKVGYPHPFAGTLVGMIPALGFGLRRRVRRHRPKLHVRPGPRS
jgi:hypothetical protein